MRTNPGRVRPDPAVGDEDVSDRATIRNAVAFPGSDGHRHSGPQVVHGRVHYPPEHVVTALSYMARTGAGLGGGRERVNGLRLTPSDFAGHIGQGPEVQGSAISLLLATSGRPVHPAELTGAGAITLSARA